ncbi:MAG: glucose 1-dehydrogenase [Pyrinomonadaceae bacterium]
MDGIMKAIAVKPGVPDSAHIVDMPKPTVGDIAHDRGVLVKVLRVGVDGTDREINNADYGAAPPGADFLVIGHEGFGVVEEIGPNVKEIAVGDFVVSTVRRPGKSIYDLIGTSDMTTDDVYYERGINLLHGYLSEFYVENADYVVKIPKGLKEVGVLLEPMSVVQKGIAQAFEIQRRLRVWKPQRAAVLGAGTVGLLATLVLRLRGIEVVTFGKTPKPYLNADLLEAIGARYVSTDDTLVREFAEQNGRFDLILEATGYSPIIFDAMQALAKNGVLVLASVTGGDRQTDVPSDKINLEFVLGNKVMVGTVNANREYFESGVKDMSTAVLEYGDWLSHLLTTKIDGLDNFGAMFDALANAKDAIKIYCQVSE